MREGILVLFVTFVVIFISNQSIAQNCGASLSITEVKYLGKESSNDKVSVKWNLVEPSSGRCVNLSMGTLTVKITRPGGHVDTASKEISPSFGTANVIVTRGVLERDPVSYDVRYTITKSVAIFSAPVSTTLSASGVTTKSVNQGGSCPNLNINPLTSLGHTSQGDKFVVSTTFGPLICLAQQKADFTLAVRHQSGQTCIFTHSVPSLAPSNDTIVTVPCSGIDPVTGVDAKVDVSVVGTAINLSATKQGNF